MYKEEYQLKQEQKREIREKERQKRKINCIFDKCSGPEGQLKMFVNDQPNFEFENYIMRDGDKIEIIMKG